MTRRHLTIDEKRLMLALVTRAANLSLPAGWLDCVEVSQMNDGGMGSLHFHSASGGSNMAKCVSELKFRDADGVDVFAYLDVDDEGTPFELDVWKVDFSPLIQIADQFDETRIEESKGSDSLDQAGAPRG